MSCKDYEIALGDYVDGTLDERARVELDAHLASCERCRALVTDFSVMRQATLALEPELPSPRVWNRLSAALEVERGRTLRGWGFAWQTVAASVVAVALIASLSWVGSGLSRIDGTSARVASPPASPAAPISVSNSENVV